MSCWRQGIVANFFNFANFFTSNDDVRLKFNSINHGRSFGLGKSLGTGEC